MKKLLGAILLTFLAGACFAQSPSPFPYTKLIPNDPTTGTTLFTLTKVNSSGNAVIMSTSDTTGYTGVCIDNCGKAGNALIAFGGLVPLTVDGTTTASHYIQISSGTGGDGTDSGATTYPSSGDVIGRVQQASTGAASLSMIDLFPAEILGSTAASCPLSNGVIAKTGNYLLTGANAGSLITFSGSTLTATLPAAAPSSTWCVNIQNINASPLTISPNSINLNGATTSVTLQQFQILTVWTNGTVYEATLPDVAGTGITLTPASNGMTHSLTNTATTINGQTATLGAAANVNAGDTVHTVGINEGNGNQIAGAGPGAANQCFLSGGSSADPTYVDCRDVHIAPAANCANATAGGGWNYATSTWTAACRGGTNNLGGSLQCIPSTGCSAQFTMELPGDWDTTMQPYISIYYGSGANTTGTVIWTVSSACTKIDGSVTDDPAFNAESAFASQTMANANRNWAKGGQYTAVTSGNNCIKNSQIIFKVALSGTAASAINAYQAVITIPVAPVVQAN